MNMETLKNELGHFVISNTCPACGFTATSESSNENTTDKESDDNTRLTLSERFFHLGREIRGGGASGSLDHTRMHLRDDPSIPRIGLACRNEKCDGQEAMYYRMSQKDLSYLYQCVTCNHTWTDRPLNVQKHNATTAVSK